MRLKAYRAGSFDFSDSLLHRCFIKTPAPMFFSMALVLLCMMVSGCKDLKVKQPLSDPTPPTLVWNVYNHETGQQKDLQITSIGQPSDSPSFNGATTIMVQRGSHYRIMLKAEDPEGVKSIAINPSYYEGDYIPPAGVIWNCSDPADATNVQSNYTEIEEMIQNLSPDSDGMVLTHIVLPVELDFAMPCQPGWRLDWGEVILGGHASNYFDGIVSQYIRFRVEQQIQ